MLAPCVAERGRRNTSGVEYNVPFREESCKNSCIYNSPFTQLQPWYRPASIRPPALVRSQSIWSIAGAYYEHWATSLDNFSVTLFFGGNFSGIWKKSGIRTYFGLVELTFRNLATLNPRKLQGFHGTLLSHCYTLTSTQEIDFNWTNRNQNIENIEYRIQNIEYGI